MRTHLAALLGAVTLLAPFSSAQSNPINFKPVAAEYSRALDRIILVSANPNELHIYNAGGNSDTAVSLSKAPTSVSVSPDGLFAAVGHDQLITYVDLNAANVVKTLAISTNVQELVLGPSFVYVLPNYSVNISTGTVTQRVDATPATGGRILSNGNTIFSTRTGANPNNLQKFDTLGSAISGRSSSPYTAGQFDICGKIWFSLDESRVYNSCGTIFQPGDMRFYRSFSTLTRLTGLSESVSLALLAAIPDPTVSGQSDSEIRLFERDSLRQNGRFAVAPINNAAGHARWVFFSTNGANLYSVNKADATDDFVVQKLVLFDPLKQSGEADLTSPCSSPVTLGAASANIPGFGSYGSIGITAPADCLYGASSDSWITITSGTILSGSGTLTYLVRPNPGPSARSGSINIGSQTLTINQDAPGALTSFTRLPYRIKDAEFSKAVDKIVFVTTNPDEVHIYDPVTNVDKWVALVAPPLSVSVRPDGMLAAVGQSGVLSIIDVSAGNPYATIQVPTIGKDVVFGSNGYAYISGPNETGDFGAVDLTFGFYIRGTGTLGAPMKLNPGQPNVYVGSGTISRLNFPPLPFVLQSPPAANSCGGLFPTEDGGLIYTGCGEVRRTNASAAADLSLAGSLSALGNGNGVLSASDSSLRRTTVLIPYPLASNPPVGLSEVQAYADDSLNFTGKIQLPGFTVGATTYSGRGNFVFWNASATKLFVLETAESAANLASPWAVYTIGASALGDGCGVTLASPSVTISGAGGSASVGVSTGSNCAYVATASDPWITITAGGFGIGSGSVQVTAAPAVSNSPRAGTVTIGNQVLTVNQGGIPIIVTLAPTSANFTAAGGPGGFNLTSSSGSFAWTATANVAWITNIVFGGTGSGPVTFTVQANASANPRTGLISAGGQTFTVNQTGVPATVGVSPTSFNIAAAGGSGSVTVTVAPADFIWAATSNAAFLSITSGLGGTGSGTVTFTVDANPTLSARSGTMTIAGQTVTVNQAAGSPSITLTPGFSFFTAAAGTGTFNVNTVPSAFAWVATSNSPWITITAGAAGNGFGTVSYSVLANTGSTTRTGTISINSQTFTVSQAGTGATGGGTGLRFVPVAPCRIADTRNPAGPFGGPTLSGTRDFNIPASNCGIPAGAAAYSLNITVVPQGQLSYLSIWPAGSPQPLVSTLNSFDGRIKANAAIVPAGANGAISVFTSNPSDVVIDINGYFTSSTGEQTLVFYPVTPCRMADTRGGPGPLTGPTMNAGQARTFPLLTSGCGVPATAKAYSLNMTAIPQGGLSYLTTWPTGSAQPLVSTLNSPTGTVVANAAIVPAGLSGAIDVFVTDKTDIVIDVNGYFAPPAAGGLSFYTATPCRVVDTRNPSGPFGGPTMGVNGVREFILPFSACNLPATAKAYSLNATVVPGGSLSYLTLWPFGDNQPVVSTLNAFDGSVTSNAAIVPAGVNGGVSAYVTNPTDLILDINGYFAP